MPNDALFESPTDAPVVPETPAPPAEPAFTRADAEALVEQRTSLVNQDLAALRRENDALKVAIQQTQTTPAAEPSGDDFVANFNKNPLAAIKQVADQSSSAGLMQLAPHLNTLINSANESFLSGQQFRIEQEFGEQAWKEVFRPQLTEVFQVMRRENPFAIADIQRVQREVNTVIGANYDKLTALRATHAQGKDAGEATRVAKLVEEVRRGTTNLTGGFRQTPKGGAADLDPDLKAAIADMDRHTGLKTNLTEFTKNMVAAQNSKDLDEWLSNTKPAGRA